MKIGVKRPNRLKKLPPSIKYRILYDVILSRLEARGTKLSLLLAAQYFSSSSYRDNPLIICIMCCLGTLQMMPIQQLWNQYNSYLVSIAGIQIIMKKEDGKLRDERVTLSFFS